MGPSGALRSSRGLSPGPRASPQHSPDFPGFSRPLPASPGPEKPDFFRKIEKKRFFRKSGFRNSANQFVYSVKDRTVLAHCDLIAKALAITIAIAMAIFMAIVMAVTIAIAIPGSSHSRFQDFRPKIDFRYRKNRFV